MRHLIFFLLALSTLTSCVTYKRCQDKFGAGTRTDTTYITRTDTVRVPADSAAFTVKTDTTYLTQIVKQGNAVVTMTRTPQTTQVKADCLPQIITRTIRVPVATTVNQFDNSTGWKHAFFVALGFASMLGAGWVLVLSRKRHTVNDGDTNS